MPPTTHDERLHVPLGWWLLGLGFALSLVIAIGAYLGQWWALGMALASLLVIAILFLGYGSARVRVDEVGVRAGSAVLEWPWVGPAEALVGREAKDALGAGASVTAHYLTRPYTNGAVRITVDDPADPHPYWLVSTRHAERVAALVNERRDAARGH